MDEATGLEQTLLDYLRKVNPTVMGRAPDPSALKLRRILDSLDMVDFFAFLERSFGLRVTDQDVLSRNFETVASTVAFVRGKTARG